ncbi:MAG: hypothetical protein WD577_07420 [Bacteroidales bacterium]
MKLYRIILITFAFTLTQHVNAQQEEVRVVKPYNPTLSGAEKIQLLPDIGDSVGYDPPEFEYSIFSKRFETDYRVTPIKPARMVKPALNKLYKSELKLGGGNYLTPLAELRINQVRSSDGTFGVLLKHHSMNGKTRLANDQNVEAGFNENQLELYGKRFGRRTIFEYNAGASYDTYVHYGVDTAFADTVNRKEMTHPFFNAHAAVGFQSARPDSFHMQYNGTLDYNFFTHAFDQMEHGAVLDGTVDQLFGDFRIGSDVGVSYYGHQADWDTLLTNQFMIKVNPYISKSSAEWMFRAGINTYTEIRNGELLPHFYVKGKFSFNIVREVLVPYFGVDGYQETNNYMKITEENPYAVPGLVVTPTNHRIIVYTGLKGKVTDYLAWNFRGSYSAVDDQYFFVTDTTNDLHNQFTVRYDDMTVMNVYGELNIAPTESFRMFLKGNFYDYQTSREDYAWYKPAFDASLQARYNLGDKILTDAGLFVIGPRYYPSLVEGGDPEKLNTTIDLNLGVEYRYTSLLSFWARFNNISAQPYYMWNNYPSYRFRLMLGFTYGM